MRLIIIDFTKLYNMLCFHHYNHCCFKYHPSTIPNNKLLMPNHSPQLLLKSNCYFQILLLLHYYSSHWNTQTIYNTNVKANKYHMMLISMLTKTLPAAGAEVHWKHRSIRRIKRPKQSMLALLAHIQKWIKVDREMRSKWERDRAREGRRREWGGWLGPASNPTCHSSV